MPCGALAARGVGGAAALPTRAGDVGGFSEDGGAIDQPLETRDRAECEVCGLPQYRSNRGG